MAFRVSSQKSYFSSPLFVQRAIIVIVCIFLAFSFAPTSAQAAVKRAYAGIVVDAKSGKTLYSRAADAQRYPASLTKVMTLYVLFQELEAGRLKLSSKMRVSKHAANAVPSKLGLRVGSTISVENAIKALVTKSANDVARVIAEHISGTETKFALRMTKVARSLGMKRTTYANASGLPNSRQITTVRDQSRLGIAIYQHFPKYYKYFQTRSFKYKGKTYGNHNRLLGQNGVDGIKTGYIRASGFNLLTAARKNNRHIVVVAFGFDSGSARNAKVAALVKKNLPKARRGGYVAQARIAKPSITGSIVRVAVQVTPMPRPASRMPSNLVANAPIPNAPTSTQPIAVASLNSPLANQNPISPTPMIRPINLLGQNSLAQTGLTQNQKPAPIQQAAIDLTKVPTPTQRSSTRVNLSAIRAAPNPTPKNALDVIGAWITDSRKPNLRQGSALSFMPPANIGSNNQTIDLMTSGSINSTKQIETGWIVQVGAANSTEIASNLIVKAKNKLPELSNLRSNIQLSEKNGQKIYRARFLGFGNKATAQSACDRLKSKKVSCLLVQS